MTLTPITVELDAYPIELRSLLLGANLYDSSCSPEARVLFVDKDEGYFLKTAPKGTLEREAKMTEYFYEKKLAAKPLIYISADSDYLLTDKIKGEDCTADKYLYQPERLCDIIAERLLMLHNESFSDCPIPNHTENYLKKAQSNKNLELYDKSHFPDSFGYASPEEAWAVVKRKAHLLQTDTLLHGDYCLPNIILNDWRFAGFIDLDSGGVGDRHVDVFWAIWTLGFNLKTDKYRQRFIDAYGRSRIDEELLRVVAAVEVFG